MNARSGSVKRFIDRCFEHSFIFNINQVLLDGGKHAPMRRFLSDVPSDAVIDLGCGPGNWVELAEEEYVGVDTSESFIDTCREKHGDDSNKQFLHADVASLELDRSFDLAMLISVLHHLSDEQIGETVDRLADHARYLFVMDLYPIHHNPISRWLYRMDRGNHIREPDQQRNLITASGQFQLVKEDEFHSWNRLYRHTMFLFESNQ